MVIPESLFPLWLESKVNNSHDQRYRHQFLEENTDWYEEGIQELKTYVHRAHEDARNHLRKLAASTLDPLGAPSSFDPSQGYPEQLDILTLKGYLGEIFAALIIEHFAPFGNPFWIVPAFLFRFHNLAYDRLEEIRAGKPAKPTPGRTGNDCLAFQFDEQGKVLRVLCAEAKCSGQHDSTLIANAHAQIGKVDLVSMREVITILKEHNEPLMLAWAEGIREFWLLDPDGRCERFDLVSYVCGQRPKKQTWLPVDHPHTSYQGGRRLEAVEIHLDDVESILQQVYRKQSRNITHESEDAAEQ